MDVFQHEMIHAFLFVTNNERVYHTFVCMCLLCCRMHLNI